MRQFKQILLVLILALLVIVMVQNAAPVQFHFLNWTYDVSQLLLVTIVFVIGFLAGFLTAKWPKRKAEDDTAFTPTDR